MIIAGIDYSLTSPAICVHDGERWKVENCCFYYLVHRERSLVTTGQFYGEMYSEWECDARRYDNLAEWSSRVLSMNKVQKCFVEGYAFNAVGRVFQIAENTGQLKYRLWKSGIPFRVFAPPEIKKFATTKGNANKEKMYEVFLQETMVDIRSKLDILNMNQWNPISDIVDSYYIAKLGFMKERENVDQA